MKMKNVNVNLETNESILNNIELETPKRKFVIDYTVILHIIFWMLYLGCLHLSIHKPYRYPTRYKEIRL